MPKLTKRSVEALRVRTTNYIAFDAELHGFGVRVMPSGKRFFLVQYRRHGRTPPRDARAIRASYGRGRPATSLNTARPSSKRWIRSGCGARRASAVVHGRATRGAVLERACLRAMQSHDSERIPPLGRTLYRPVLRQATRSLGHDGGRRELHGTFVPHPLPGEPHAWSAFKDDESRGNLGVARSTLESMRGHSALSGAQARALPSPAGSEGARRVLDGAESDGSEGKYACTAFRLLLLTGCRLSEIQKLKWRTCERELRLPDSKTGVKTVHLEAAAIALLRSLPRVEMNPFVIAGKNAGSYLTDLQRPWRRIRGAAGLENVRIHDLRHTFASGGLAVGEGLSMIGKLLGHTQVQTTARYAHLAADRVKQAADKIAERLAGALLNGPSSVLPGHEDTAAGQ
jgi:Phage integrase family/Arm DNA-binding domain